MQALTRHEGLDFQISSLDKNFHHIRHHHHHLSNFVEAYLVCQRRQKISHKYEISLFSQNLNATEDDENFSVQAASKVDKDGAHIQTFSTCEITFPEVQMSSKDVTKVKDSVGNDDDNSVNVTST